LTSWLSPFWLSPPLISPAKPSRFFLKMRFTTPATASEPQAAEAPPVTTSTRSIMMVGMTFRSTRPVAVEGVKRSRSTSTRVRLAPRLRRFTRFRPELTELCAVEAGVVAEPKAGTVFRKSATLVVPDFCSSCSPTVVVGVGAVKPARSTRDAVTTSSPMAVS
jgi:hypothetical protein